MEFIEIKWQDERYGEEIELRDRLLRAPLGLTFSKEQFAEEASHFHFGILDQERLVACAVIVPLAAKLAKLRQMVVAETHQRRGVGSKLVQCIEATLIEREIETIELHARDTAIGFYERLGYEKEGEPFTEVSIPHWKMSKRIGDPMVGE